MHAPPWAILAAACAVAGPAVAPLAGTAAPRQADLEAAARQADFEDARATLTESGIRAHLSFLSHDLLAGRAPGTRGGGIAAQYIAAQLLRTGLEPVNGSFFQTVALTGTRTDPDAAGLAFEAEGERVGARYPDDAVIWPGRPEPQTTVTGELVFVGYGAEAPEWDWDDFKGRDVRGAILVFIVGDPPAPPDEPRLFDGRALTYYGRWTYKLEEARRRGAAGALIIHAPESAGYGWDVVRSSFIGERLALAGAGSEALRLNGWLTRDFARELFGAAGLQLEELYVRASRRDFRPVATGLTVRARMTNRSREVTTRNVVGLLPGSDSARAREVVVVTSHYDHLGIGAAVDGDSIHNGAYDNASGVALLLEVAGALARLETRPARSVLFIATAAEEAGMLGSEHYVRRPLFPLRRTVAALNVDGANLWGETDDIIALGADRSTLGDIVGARAEELGQTVMPDPAPENGSFFRSDHLPFARAGIPALFLQHGLRFRDRPAGWGERVMADYHRSHYHRPSDEYDPDFDLAGAVQQARLVFGVTYDIAQWDDVGRWYEGEGFGPASRVRAPSDGR